MTTSTTILGSTRRPVVDEPTRPPEVGTVTSLVVSSPGGSVDVASRPWRVLEGTTGLGPTEAVPDTVRLPSRDGLMLRDLDGQRGVQVQARTIELRLRVGPSRDLATPGAVATEVARLQRLLNPRAFGPGTVTVSGTRWDGEVRSVDCLWVPLDGDFEPPPWWAKKAYVTVRLLCPSPWWRVPARPITWRTAAPAGPMLPFFPLRLGSSTVLGTANPVPVDGVENSPLVAELNGPASNITLARGDGLTFTVTPPATTGTDDLVVVRTDPFTGVVDDFYPVTGPSGESWDRYLEPGTSVLWSLRPGVEQVTALIEGATNDTRLTVRYDHLYRELV